jgi:hypothetical protein
MAHANLSTEEAETKMTDALRIAMSAWKKADMPELNPKRDVGYKPEVGKIALAQIACKLFDALE